MRNLIALAALLGSAVAHSAKLPSDLTPRLEADAQVICSVTGASSPDKCINGYRIEAIKAQRKIERMRGEQVYRNITIPFCVRLSGYTSPVEGRIDAGELYRCLSDEKTASEKLDALFYAYPNVERELRQYAATELIDSNSFVVTLQATESLVGIER